MRRPIADSKGRKMRWQENKTSESAKANYNRCKRQEPKGNSRVEWYRLDERILPTAPARVR